MVRFGALPFLSPDRLDHFEAAQLRNRARRRGVQVATIDAILAQLCIRYELRLLTTDADFARIAEHEPLGRWIPYRNAPTLPDSKPGARCRTAGERSSMSRAHPGVIGPKPGAHCHGKRNQSAEPSTARTRIAQSGYLWRGDRNSSPDFDGSERAFYYVRLLEVPTPRWTAYDARRFGITMGPEVPMTIQERVRASPFRYTPP